MEEKSKDHWTIAMIFIGIAFVGFVLSVYFEIFNPTFKNVGVVPAVSFIFLILGIMFYFPSMLKDSGDNSNSSMRIGILIIVLMFAFVHIKMIWNSEVLVIDSSWTYILGIVFTGKALQKYSENQMAAQNSTTSVIVEQGIRNDLFTGNGSSDIDTEQTDPDRTYDEVREAKSKLITIP